MIYLVSRNSLLRILSLITALEILAGSFRLRAPLRNPGLGIFRLRNIGLRDSGL